MEKLFAVIDAEEARRRATGGASAQRHRL